MWNYGGYGVMDDVSAYVSNTCANENQPYRWIGGGYNKIKRSETTEATLDFVKVKATNGKTPFKPEKAVAMHFGKDQLHKLEARDWPHVRDLKFYRLEKGEA